MSFTCCVYIHDESYDTNIQNTICLLIFFLFYLLRLFLFSALNTEQSTKKIPIDWQSRYIYSIRCSRKYSCYRLTITDKKNMFRQTSVILIIIILNFLLIINTQHLPLCESLDDIEGDENVKNNSAIKSRRIRALCDAIYSTRTKSEPDDLESIPDFDLTQITSGKDILENLWMK